MGETLATDQEVQTAWTTTARVCWPEQNENVMHVTARICAIVRICPLA